MTTICIDPSSPRKKKKNLRGNNPYLPYMRFWKFRSDPIIYKLKYCYSLQRQDIIYIITRTTGDYFGPCKFIAQEINRIEITTVLRFGLIFVKRVLYGALLQQLWLNFKHDNLNMIFDMLKDVFACETISSQRICKEELGLFDHHVMI